MTLTTILLQIFLLSPSSSAIGESITLSQYGAGEGPRLEGTTLHLLDAEQSFGQSNALAFPQTHSDARQSAEFRAEMFVRSGGDGGALLFLNTEEYGVQGPAPHVRSWTEPHLRRSFSVGIDVHNPRTEEPFGDAGNILGLPEREVSLHWDGRELVRRLAPTEFRDDWSALQVSWKHVSGGAEVTVKVGESVLYDDYFIAEMHPYPVRLGVGAGTRADVATEFSLRNVAFTLGDAAAPVRQPLHVELFNHVLTDNSKTSFETEVDLPPLEWEFGRIVLTLEIHDAGADWDEWDRLGQFYVFDDEGNRWDFAPFITSYRTECYWKVDVTHFRPWFTGKRKFQIVAGTNFYKNRGYMMSASLDFHHGAPSDGLDAFHVQPLWSVRATYKSEENHFSDAFEPQDVEVPADATAARIYTTTSGHSQVGEFTPSDREILFTSDPSAVRISFENTLWKTDVYLNPNRPQYGTWKYPRAGWAPGDMVWPWTIDLTRHIQPGKTARFEYHPKPYDFSERAEDQRPTPGQINAANHVVRSYVVFSRPAGNKVAAPVLKVTNVAGGSNAAKIGVKQGDYFASYDGKTIDSIEQLTAAKAEATAAGKTVVPLVVYRGSERLELEIPVGQLGVNLSTR